MEDGKTFKPILPESIDKEQQLKVVEMADGCRLPFPRARLYKQQASLLIVLEKPARIFHHEKVDVLIGGAQLF